MKIAVVGKGGVGKTTVAALLARSFAARGRRVFAIDADPDANFASALPLDGAAPEPLARRQDLIRRASESGALPEGLFLLNPETGDLMLEGTAAWGGGHRLLVLGWGKGGGAGCYCAENAVLRRLLNRAVTGPDEVVIVDSEAGLEHLSRGTAAAVDVVLAVVQPGFRSAETAITARHLARELGVPHVHPVLCGARSAAELRDVAIWFGDWRPIASFPYDEAIRYADLHGRMPPLAGPTREAAEGLADQLLHLLSLSPPTSRQPA